MREFKSMTNRETKEVTLTKLGRDITETAKSPGIREHFSKFVQIGPIAEENENANRQTHRAHNMFLMQIRNKWPLTPVGL